MKRITAAALAAAIAAGAAFQAAPASADPARGPIRAERDNRDAAIALGIVGAVAGFVVGNAVSGNGNATVHRRPVPPTPSGHIGHYRKPAPKLHRPWSREWFRYCFETYRSFDPKKGTYRGYDGRTHFCEAPVNPRKRDHGGRH